jgi:hypothetical protein
MTIRAGCNWSGELVRLRDTARAQPAAAALSLCSLAPLLCLQFLLLLTALLIWEVIYIIVSAVQYKVHSRTRFH